jgi:hypothetical protein
MVNLTQIKKEIKALNKNLDGITDELINKLNDYQSGYEKMLLKTDFDLDSNKRFKQTTKNLNKANKLSINKLGFNKLAVSHIEQYDDVVKEQIAFNKSIGIVTDLKFNDVSILKYFKDLDLASMMGESEQLDRLIKKQLVNAIALKSPWQKTIKNLSKDVLGIGIKDGALSRYANTYMRTSLYGLSRTVDKAIYDRIGNGD